MSTRKFVGTFDCLRTTYSAEGVRGLYAGVGISLFGQILFKSLYLGGYDSTKLYFKLEESSFGVRLLAAQLVTVVCGTICYPIDSVKRRLMIQSTSLKMNSLRYKGAIDCFQRVIKEEGFRRLFSGLSVNLIRSFSGGILLVGYDEFKKIFQNKNLKYKDYK